MIHSINYTLLFLSLTPSIQRYQAVDPAHRLVAAILEQRWEEALRHARQLQEAYERFLRETPPQVQAAEWARLTAVASDMPATTPKARPPAPVGARN